MTAMRLLILLALASALFAQPRVPIDNGQARVLVVSVPPHQKGAMHEHRMNRVMIYLTKADLRLKGADGKVDDQHWKAGAVAWSPARGLHTSESLDDVEQRIVEIELKRPKSAVTLPALDPKRDKLEFENDQVRVFRAHSAPPKSSSRIFVPLSPPGDVTWELPPAQTGEILVVDLKTP